MEETIQYVYSMEMTHYLLWALLFFVILTLAGVVLFGLRSKAPTKYNELVRAIEKSGRVEELIVDLLDYVKQSREILTPNELAEKQKQARVIRVLSDRPLESRSQDVLNSTISWLKAKQQFTPQQCRIEFWLPANTLIPTGSNNQYRINEVAQEIGMALSALVQKTPNPDLLRKVNVIAVPEYFLPIDFTIWEMDESAQSHSFVAFANDTDGGLEVERTYRGFRLKPFTTTRLVRLLNQVSKRGQDITILVDREDGGAGATTVQLDGKLVTWEKTS